MPNMNDCKICGNLVRDPEIKNTSSGKAVATMTVAVNRFLSIRTERSKSLRIMYE